MSGRSREVGVTGEHVKGLGNLSRGETGASMQKKSKVSQGPAAQAVTVKLMEMLESEDESKTNSPFQLS